jgi:two-component system, NtrC family, sensor histidine kinase PilS
MGDRDAGLTREVSADTSPFLAYFAPAIGRRNILWIIVARILISTLVLGIGAALEAAPPDVLGLDAALSALASIYLLSSIYLLLALINSHYVQQLKMQVFGDLLAVTLLIYLSKEAASPYSSLYLLIITYATLLIGKNIGVAAAAGSTILYIGMIDLAFFDLIPFGSMEMRFGTMNFRSAVVVLGFVAVSYLSATLSDRLLRVRLELEEKSGSLADLRIFSDNVIESLRSGIITTDLEGNVRTANRSTVNLLEIPLYGLIGKPMDSLFPEDFVRWILAEGGEVRQEPLRREFWSQSGSGRRKYFGFSVSPLFNQRHELIGFIVSFQDLTEIKRLQEKVAVKDRMSAVGRLAAGIAHEIRNPLAAMHGSIQVLRKAIQLEDDDLRLMDIVLRESNRLNQIIEDFLKYARPKPLDRHRIDLIKIAEETVSLIRNHPATGSGYEILLEGAGNPLWMEGDTDLLRQVCWNLASNALKAMPNGGRLRISGQILDGNRIGLSFIDQGIGMDEEDLSLVFQPFHSRFREGLGIGMAIVYQIMEQHGGKIDIQSAKGQGTTVRLEFERS